MLLLSQTIVGCNITSSDLQAVARNFGGESAKLRICKVISACFRMAQKAQVKS